MVAAKGYSKIFKTVLILMVCAQGLCAELFRDFKASDKNQEYIKRMLTDSDQYTNDKHAFAHSLKRFEVSEWKKVWKPLGNLSLSYKLSGANKYLNATRHKLMVLCSYEIWGNPENKFPGLGLDAAFPIVQSALAYDSVQDSLTTQERKKILKKYSDLGAKYLEMPNMEKKPPWHGKLNDPHYSFHLLAMYLLGRTLENSDKSLAKALIFNASFSFSKITDLYQSNMDGGSALGPVQGLLFDYGLLIYAECERQRSKETILKNKWVSKKGDWYKGTVLPGYANQVLLGDSLPTSILATEPIIFLLANWYKDSACQNIAKGMIKARYLKKSRTAYDNWMFLNVLFCDTSLKSSVSSSMQTYNFNEAGVYTAISGRGGYGNFLSFSCGAPAGEVMYKHWKMGNKNVNYKYIDPDSGSFTWYVGGRHILTDTGYHKLNLTNHHNTLVVGEYGQVMENPEYYLSGKMDANDRRSRLLAYHRVGDSVIMRAQCRGAYPQASGLTSFDRTLIWLGPEILVLIDMIDCIQEKELSLYFRSLDYPLVEKSDGFYQKITGMQLHSSSLPKAKWKVASDYHTHLRKKNHYAVATVNSKKWVQAVVIGTPSLGQDVSVKTKLDGYEVEFGAFKYKLNIKRDVRKDWLKLSIHDKQFFKLSGEKSLE